jgi:hypothetical protein
MDPAKLERPPHMYQHSEQFDAGGPYAFSADSPPMDD